MSRKEGIETPRNSIVQPASVRLSELERENGSETTLPEACLTLPLVCQEGVKDALDRLQRMKEEGSWFKVRTLEELNHIVPQAQEQAQHIFDGLRRYKTADNSWGMALYMARSTTWDASWYADMARNAIRVRVQDTAWCMARDAACGTAWYTSWGTGHAARSTAWDAAGDVARATAWEVVKDLPGFGTNHFSPFLSLYELGSAGIEFHRVEKTNEDPEEMLTVHFPLKLNDDRLVLACLAFPDGRPGDKTVQYAHSWGKHCSEIAPLNPPTQREIK